MIYHPRTEVEAEAVRAARMRAGELRAELAGELALKESALRRRVDGSAAPAAVGAPPGLRLLAQTWEPRTLRSLNLNIGEGAPTGHGDMADIAEIINREGANVVTIQEVFEEHLGELEAHLDGEWEIYFANAGNKFNDASPTNWSDPFGNAVLVRQGDGISSQSIEDNDTVKLDVPGTWHPTPGGGPRQYSDVDPEDMVTETVSADEIPDESYPKDGEGRAAAVAEIIINP